MIERVENVFNSKEYDNFDPDSWLDLLFNYLSDSDLKELNSVVDHADISTSELLEFINIRVNKFRISRTNKERETAADDLKFMIHAIHQVITRLKNYSEATQKFIERWQCRI